MASNTPHTPDSAPSAALPHTPGPFDRETAEWKLDAFIRWTAKTQTQVCSRCGGRGTVGGNFADPDGPEECPSCRGKGSVTLYPESPMPEVPPALIEHMRKAWHSYFEQAPAQPGPEPAPSGSKLTPT